MPIPQDLLVEHPTAGWIWLLYDSASTSARLADEPQAACFSYRELVQGPLKSKRYRPLLGVIALVKRVFPGARLESIRSLRRRRRRIKAPAYTVVDPDEW